MTDAPLHAPSSQAPREPWRFRVFERIGPPILLLAFAGMAILSWNRWPDVLVDFGRELYVPWRLTLGARLYHDLAWFNGPLSPHVNAFLFQVLGPSLANLVAFNLALAALFTALLYWLLRRVSDPFAATVAGLAWLGMFAFGQLVGIGNYNFVTPYSHEVTHGLVLGALSLFCLERWSAARRNAWLGAAGLALGACFLTKPEIFLASVAGCGVALALLLAAAPGPDAARARRVALWFGLPLFAPALLTFAVLAGEMPLARAAACTAGGWTALFGGHAQDLAFYRQGMGVDAPWENAVKLAAWTLRWLALFGPLVALAACLKKRSEVSYAAAPAAALALLAWLVVLGRRQPWLEAFRPLPLVVLILGAAMAWRWVHEPATRAHAALSLGLCALAGAGLLKMILNARVYHYGFALALWPTLLFVVALVGWVPALLDRRGRAGSVLRIAATTAILGITVLHVQLSRGWWARKQEVVGSGADAFHADARGRFVNQVVDEFGKIAAPGSTLAVLPEGVMVNWLLHAANPTPYVNFMPPELLFFGEDAMVAAFRQNPPDYVLLVHKDTSEYGAPLFGPDYGTALATWVQQNYSVVRQYGEPPLQPNTRFGMALLRHRG